MMKDMEEFFSDVYRYFDKATNKQVYIVSLDFTEKCVTIVYYEGNKVMKRKRDFKDIIVQPYDFYKEDL